jgi:hypothetical protein
VHAVVRKYRVADVDLLVRKVEAEFAERVRQVEGFVGYYVIDGGDGVVASVTVGETEASIEETNRLAAEWVSSSVADLMDGAPEVTGGEVRVRVER